jgi:hypothetical protein
VVIIALLFEIPYPELRLKYGLGRKSSTAWYIPYHAVKKCGLKAVLSGFGGSIFHDGAVFH